MNIIDTTKSNVVQAQEWAREKGATEIFVALAAFYFDQASDSGVLPEGAYCQAAHETGFGHFGGSDPIFSATVDMHNTCGLKTHDASATARFSSWEDGISAHLDHLALYAGAVGYPKTNTLDPRHFSSVLGTCTEFDKLGGHWCPDTAYGYAVVTLVEELLTVVTNKDKIDKISLIIK